MTTKKKLLEITLGIVTAIGGFPDVGAIATAAQAGAAFGFQLMWVIVLGTICVIFLVEMSGRLAAVSQHTLVDAMRERFGINFVSFRSPPSCLSTSWCLERRSAVFVSLSNCLRASAFRGGRWRVLSCSGGCFGKALSKS